MKQTIRLFEGTSYEQEIEVETENIAIILQALTELSVKLWLVQHGRCMDAVHYTPEIEQEAVKKMGIKSTPYRCTLQEALEISKDAEVPGAIYRNSYVCIDYEDTEYPYHYVPDIESKKPDIWRLKKDMLDRLVIYALSSVWTPVSNFQY